LGNVVRSGTRSGDTVLLEGKGYLARCMQHETDHLNGVLFVDHVRERWLYHEETKERIDVWDVIRLANGGAR